LPFILIAVALGSCDKKAPSTPPDYIILGELPTDIKVIQGTAVTVFKQVSTRAAGSVPGTSNVIPVPANATLGVGPLAAGITAAFVGVAVGRPPFDARLQIDVANTVPRGSYNVQVTGTAPPVAPKTETTHIVRVYDPMDGGAYVEISPSEVVMSPGGTATVTATVTRIPPYVGPVTLSYPGAGTALPPQVRVTGLTTYTFNLGPGTDVVSKQFILEAGDPLGSTFPSAEVRTGPAVPGAKTDLAPHVVSVR